MSKVNSAEWFAEQARQNRKAMESWPAWMRDGPVYAAATPPADYVPESLDAAQIGNAKPADAGGNTHGKEGA